MDRKLNQALFEFRKQGAVIPQSLKESMSFGDIRDKLIVLIDPVDEKGERSYRYWLSQSNLYPDFCIVEDETDKKHYRIPYSVDAMGNITLGQWQEVERVWQVKPDGSTGPTPADTDLQEGAQEGFECLTRISEAKAQGGNKFRMTVLRPGWNVRLDGTPGDKYYTSQFVASLLPLIEGVKAYADHPTDREERERPARSVRELVGFWSDAKQEADGRATATLNLLESAAWLRDSLMVAIKANIPDFVGPSINGFGNYRIGEAEGRRGKIVESAKSLMSVDIVTEPGAGGTVDQLLESAKPKEDKDVIDFSKLTLEELTKQRPDLVEAAGQAKLTEVKGEFQSELDKLRESVLGENNALREELAKERVKVSQTNRITDLLRESKLPDVSQRRLTTLLESKDFYKEGALDETALKEAVDKVVAEERDYLAKLTESGKVTGMGGGESPKPEDRAHSIQAKLDNMFGVAEKK